MSRIRIRHLVEKRRADGSARFYWQPSAELRRLGWSLRRLARNAPPHRAREIAIAEAEELNRAVDSWRRETDSGLRDGRAPAADGTLDALIALYRASEDFTDLAAKTRYDYARNLDTLSAWLGRGSVVHITPGQCRELYRSVRARSESSAASLLTTLRLLLSFAEREDWLAKGANPARQLNIRRRRKRRTEADLWTAADVALIARTADALGWHSIGTAVMLNEWLGQRQGDMRALPRPRGGVFAFDQSKTGAGVQLPAEAVPQLQARIDAEIAEQAARGLIALPDTPLLLCETTGQPWQADNFRHRYADVRAVAALRAARAAFRTARRAGADWPDARTAAAAERRRVQGLKFMLLRHTAAVRLAEAGCSTAEVAAVTGHSLKAVENILQIYLVRTARTARNAFAKRSARERNGED